MKVLVDSSVRLDVFTQDPHWAGWSEEKLAVHAERDLLAINPIIYAEVSVHFGSLEELDEVLSPMDFQRLPLPSCLPDFHPQKCKVSRKDRWRRREPFHMLFELSRKPCAAERPVKLAKCLELSERHSSREWYCGTRITGVRLSYHENQGFHEGSGGSS